MGQATPIMYFIATAAISDPISGWLLCCTGSIALMQGFAKRRQEFPLQGARVWPTTTNSSSMRSRQRGIPVYLIQSSTAIKFSAPPDHGPFVIYGTTWYSWLTFTQDESGEPADLIPAAMFILSGTSFHLIER